MKFIYFNSQEYLHILFCLSYNDKQTLRTSMRRLKSMRCGRKGSRGCFRIERLISPILIGRSQQDLLIDWSSTFYVSPTIELTVERSGVFTYLTCSI